MSSITDFLNLISGARYGREVRQAIVDAISQCYEDGKAGVTDLQARQLIESAIAVNEDQQAELMNLLARIDELEGGSGEGTTESTTIEVPSFIIDSGIVENITIESSGANSRTITFNKEFTEIPIISCVVMVQQIATANYANVQVIVVKSSISTTGFKFTVANRSGSQRSATIGWFAIQPTTKTIPIDVTIPDADGMSEAEVREITNPIQTALDGIKTGYDGTVYSTPGEAVRMQFANITGIYKLSVPGSSAVLSGNLVSGDFAKAYSAFDSGKGVYAVKDGEAYQLVDASSSSMSYCNIYIGTMKAIKKIVTYPDDTFEMSINFINGSFISYDNTDSGLEATNVQAAIDDLATRLSEVEALLNITRGEGES
jgi:hypothetical protein